MSDAIEDLYRRCEQQMLGHNQLANLRKEDVDLTRSFFLSPAGKRALRGIPAVGCGGLGMRQDPLRYLIDVERDPRTAE